MPPFCLQVRAILVFPSPAWYLAHMKIYLDVCCLQRPLGLFE